MKKLRAPIGYSEWFEDGALQQCHVQLETQAINGSNSIITVSVLSKGSLVLAIKDDDWKNQINLTWGWSVGREFGSVLLHLKAGPPYHSWQDRAALGVPC